METITAVGGWGWLFFSCLACYLAWRLWKKPLSGLLRRFNSRQSSKGIGKYAPVWFALFCCGALVMGAMRIPESNIVTQHHVAIYEQMADGDWRMSSDEDDSLVFRPCPSDERNGVNVNNILSQGIGYIAERASWEERGNCKSILRSDLGFWFKDAANNFTYQRTN